MSETPLLALENVSIGFGNERVVHRLNLQVRAGERVALVGESGSGKTVTALSVLRLLPQAQIEGRILLQGADLLRKTPGQLRAVRGGDVAMVFQEPMTALNPVYPIGHQIVETLMLHEGLGRRAARARAIQLLERTGVRDPEHRVDSYAHQLSGGQRQRAMIAMAIACRPKLLIADEPTTALDMTIRARIVQLLLDLQQEENTRNGDGGMAILLITHDLNLVRRFAQRVAVMQHGHLVETGPTAEIFESPRHPYTVRLLDSLPRREIDPVPAQAPTLLHTRGLAIEYPRPLPGWRGWFRSGRFKAVDDAELSLRAGETIGIVGESGSGKSTLALALLNLIRVRSGELSFEGRPLTLRSRAQRKQLRARLQAVFQDPYGSLSPRRTVEQIVGEGLELHFPELDAPARRARVIEVLSEVGLKAASLDAYPDQFSGGQRQRIAIARALVLSPRVLVLDEPTSALDVSIQNQVLDLLRRLQRKYGISYVLISHDLAVVNALAHRLYVMKDGRIVETGDTAEVIARPRHPYTQRLIRASL